MERLFPRKSFNDKKRTLRRNQSLQLNLEEFDLDEKDLLLKKPIVPKIVYRPKVESFTMRTRRGRNGDEDKTNQDSFIAQPNLTGSGGNGQIYGVYDGHGKNIYPIII